MNTPAKTRRSNNRIQPLLDAAASLFATRGYKETTLRDIGARIEMLPGSVYYHFASKQELLLAVYEQAVNGIALQVETAVSAYSEPWQKLEAAVLAHVESIVDENDYARVMVGVTPGKVPEIKQEITALRDSYEQLFTRLVEQLPLKADVNRTLFRLMLLGALNSIQGWYQQGKDDPVKIARAYVRYLESGTSSFLPD